MVHLRLGRGHAPGGTDCKVHNFWPSCERLLPAASVTDDAMEMQLDDQLVTRRYAGRSRNLGRGHQPADRRALDVLARSAPAIVAEANKKRFL
jgi:hypothetical protein